MPSYSDKELSKMEKKLNNVYKQAQKDIQQSWDKYMAKQKPKVEALKNKSEALALSPNATLSEMTAAQDKYKKALLNMTLKDAHYQEMVNQVTTKLTETNQIATQYLNEQMPKVYCHSYNAFEDQAENINGYSFELVDESTVENLVKAGNKSLLPQKSVNIPKDMQWNTKNINSQVLQGILQGEDINKIATRLQNVTDMNRKSAIRNARTMVTGAESKGRMDSYTKAANEGVIMKKVWVSNHSERTRDWHADLSGVEKDIEEPFENSYGKIMYPGDPSADPANVYNCRCSIKTKILGFKPVAHFAEAKTMGAYAGQYQGIGVTAQYYSMLNEEKAIGNEFWKVLNAEGKPSQVWKDYLEGNASKDVTTKLDNVLAKYKGTGQPIKPGKVKVPTPAVQKPKPDLGMYQDKSMTATFYSVKAEDPTLGKEFWSILQAEANPSATWGQYLIGTAPQEVTEKLDAILLKHKGTGAWSKPVSAKTAAKKAAKASGVIDDADDLAKAKNELAVAQGNLDSLSKKTYSGIWKDDVTLADYEAKAGSIASKKAWYQDQIDHLDAHFDDLESWEKPKLSKYKQYLKDLDDFETQGKLYVQYSKEYEKAAKKVKALTPVGDTFGPDAYLQARKDAALWAKSSAEYNNLDKYYDKVAAKVHGAKTSIEHEGYYHYTWGSGPFNAPLAGFEHGYSTTGYGYKGPGKVDINVGGYGSKIRGLTSLCEKSKYDMDMWVQSGQYDASLEAFLNVSYGTLSGLTDNQLQQFIGIENVIPQFISGAINKGGGSYTPGNVLFNIYCPAGSEALYVRSDGYFRKSEHEMILQRGGTYKITRIYRAHDSVHGGNKIIVDFELHPEHGYDKFQQ